MNPSAKPHKCDGSRKGRVGIGKRDYINAEIVALTLSWINLYSRKFENSVESCRKSFIQCVASSRKRKDKSINPTTQY